MSDSIRKYYKIDKKNIAYIKFIIEAYDGIAFVTTIKQIKHKNGLNKQMKSEIIRITIVKDFEKDAEKLLTALKKEIKLTEIEKP